MRHDRGRLPFSQKPPQPVPFILPPIPVKGIVRADWWNQLYDRIADDADYQRYVLAGYTPDDPDHAAKWFDAYRERLHDLLDHAIDRTEWTP